MDLLHAHVQHAVFGAGEITQQDGEIVTITFQEPHGNKKFLYPSAFSEYLTLSDAQLSPAMEQELVEHNQKIVAKQDRLDRAERMARFRADSAAATTKKPARAKPKKKTPADS